MATNNSINVATGASGTVLVGTAVGSAPTFSGTPTLASVAFNPTTGGVVGTTTNDNASAGYVGEFVSSVIDVGAPTAATFNTATNVTSISLTAGDWDVWGNVLLVTAVTNQTQFLGWVSSVSATQPSAQFLANLSVLSAGVIATASGLAVPQLRFSLSGTTTIYLGTYLLGTAGNGAVCGGIYARRAR